MFGSKKFKEIKSKNFKNDNKRKQFFAIKNYYKSKGVGSKTKSDTKK
jgi:hypothetical protein